MFGCSTCSVEVWGSATTSHGKGLADLQKTHTIFRSFSLVSCSRDEFFKCMFALFRDENPFLPGQPYFDGYSYEAFIYRCKKIWQ